MRRADERCLRPTGTSPSRSQVPRRELDARVNWPSSSVRLSRPSMTACTKCCSSLSRPTEMLLGRDPAKAAALEQLNGDADEALETLSDRLRPTDACSCRRDSNGFHQPRSSRHSNQFATKPLFLNSPVRLEISTGLGDQGSQVRVLSPRRTRNLSAVQGFPCRAFGLRTLRHARARGAFRNLREAVVGVASPIPRVVA